MRQTDPVTKCAIACIASCINVFEQLFASKKFKLFRDIKEEDILNEARFIERLYKDKVCENVVAVLRQATFKFPTRFMYHYINMEFRKDSLAKYYLIGEVTTHKL